ncbi:hypothetical protein SFC08_16765 [Lysinibacillus halotolerans]
MEALQSMLFMFSDDNPLIIFTIYLVLTIALGVLLGLVLAMIVLEGSGFVESLLKKKKKGDIASDPNIR